MIYRRVSSYPPFDLDSVVRCHHDIVLWLTSDENADTDFNTKSFVIGYLPVWTLKIDDDGSGFGRTTHIVLAAYAGVVVSFPQTMHLPL